MAEQTLIIPGHGLSLKARESSSLAMKHIFDQLHGKAEMVELGLGISQDCSQKTEMKMEVPTESWLWSTMHNSSFDPHQRSVCLRPSSVIGKLPQSQQLTFFYSGIVNVYDDVPADKAHAIMVLAGTCSTSSWSFVSNDDSPNVAILNTDGSKNVMEIKHPQPQPQHKLNHPHSELPQARKASLSRFLERRRHRIDAKVLNVEKFEEEDQNITNVDDNGCYNNDVSPMEKSPHKRPLSRPMSPSPSISRSRCNSPSHVCEE